MTAKDITLDFIIDYCKKNKQQAWYNAQLDTQYTQKVYPRVKKDGKTVVDKSQPYTEVARPITFIQLRQNFIAAFMPELLPAKKDTVSKMFTRL